MNKEWCTYGYESPNFPQYVGKVVYESKNKKSVDILYSEGQLYSPELWDATYVRRFDTLEEAFEYLIENEPSYDTRMDHAWTRAKHWEHVKYCFPSYFEND